MDGQDSQPNAGHSARSSDRVLAGSICIRPWQTRRAAEGPSGRLPGLLSGRCEAGQFRIGGHARMRQQYGVRLFPFIDTAKIDSRHRVLGSACRREVGVSGRFLRTPARHPLLIQLNFCYRLFLIRQLPGPTQWATLFVCRNSKRSICFTKEAIALWNRSEHLNELG